jgi:hypothetical protein
VIANAGIEQSNLGAVAPPMKPEEVSRLCLAWAPVLFDNKTPSAFLALLEELVGLGVLSQRGENFESAADLVRKELGRRHGIVRNFGIGADLEPVYESLSGWSPFTELSLKVGDGGNREGGISWGCLTPPLLHRRSDMPCPKITSSS